MAAQKDLFLSFLASRSPPRYQIAVGANQAFSGAQDIVESRTICNKVAISITVFFNSDDPDNNWNMHTSTPLSVYLCTVDGKKNRSPDSFAFVYRSGMLAMMSFGVDEILAG